MSRLDELAEVYAILDSMSIDLDQTIYSDDLDRVLLFIEQEIHRAGGLITDSGRVVLEIPVEELWKKS